jgi:hypothetical protein
VHSRISSRQDVEWKRTERKQRGGQNIKNSITRLPMGLRVIFLRAELRGPGCFEHNFAGLKIRIEENFAWSCGLSPVEWMEKGGWTLKGQHVP